MSFVVLHMDRHRLLGEQFADALVEAFDEMLEQSRTAPW